MHARRTLADSYKRFLVGELRDAFDLHGVPVRLELRQRKPGKRWAAERAARDATAAAAAAARAPPPTPSTMRRGRGSGDGARPRRRPQ